MASSIGLKKSSKTKAGLASDLALVRPVARDTSAARFQSHLTKLEAVADLATVIAAVMSGYAVYHLL